MSIAGCRLTTGPPGSAFIADPSGQASTECPLSPLQQLNFWIQIPSQLSHFPNSNNDHCDLGFIVTAGDGVRRPSRGHEVAMEDLRSKGVEGCVVPPPDPGIGVEGGSADVAGR